MRIAATHSILLLLELAHQSRAIVDAGSSFDCRCWAAQGQCDSNAAFMLNHCAASCTWKKTCDNEHECLAALDVAQARIRELEQRLAKYESIGSEGSTEISLPTQEKDAPRELNLAPAISNDGKSQQCSNSGTACSDQDTRLADIIERLATLTAAFSQLDASNNATHSELEAKIEQRSQALVDQINALEQQVKIAPSNQERLSSRRVASDTTVGSGAAWFSNFSIHDIAGNMSAHAESFSHITQLVTRHAWDACLIVHEFGSNIFDKLRNYTHEATPHAWTLLESSREHCGELLRRSWTSFSELSKYALDALPNQTNGTSTETISQLSVFDKTSLPVACASVLLALILGVFFRKRLYQVISLPVRLAWSLCKLLLRIVFSPILLLRRCFSCRRCRKNDGSQPVKADLGLKSEFYYCKETGKWRHRGKEHLEVDDVPPPPPPMGGSMPGRPEPTQPPSMLDNLMAPPNPHAGVLNKRPPATGPLAARSFAHESPQPPSFNAQTVPPNHSAGNLGRRPEPRPPAASQSPFSAPKKSAPASMPSAPVVYNLSPRAPDNNGSLSSLFDNNIA